MDTYKADTTRQETSLDAGQTQVGYVEVNLGGTTRRYVIFQDTDKSYNTLDPEHWVWTPHRSADVAIRETLQRAKAELRQYVVWPEHQRLRGEGA